jgi:hypothetical protein
VASWRPLDQSRGAIKIGGSPFTTFAAAEGACNIMLKNLTRKTECRSWCRYARPVHMIRLTEPRENIHLPLRGTGLLGTLPIEGALAAALAAEPGFPYKITTLITARLRVAYPALALRAYSLTR